jgi:phage tail tape-measure protein
MSNEFSRKFVAGVQVHARAADSVDHTGDILGAIAKAAQAAARRLRGI